MKRSEVLDILGRHQQELAGFGLLRLAIFGSVARDEAGPNSDVDILVEFNGETTFSRYAKLYDCLEDMLPRPVDLAIASSIRPVLREGVEEDAYEVPELQPVS